MKIAFLVTGTTIAMTLVLIAGGARAENAPPAIQWLTDEEPFYHLQGKRGEFPFKISNKVAGYVVLVPEKESPNVGGAVLQRNGVEKVIPVPDNDTVKRLGLAQLKPGNDYIVLRAAGMGNGGLCDSILLGMDPETEVTLWIRDDNIQGNPKHTVSPNYDAPQLSAERKYLDSLWNSLFSGSCPKRRGAAE
jgi:hypothetical protein